MRMKVYQSKPRIKLSPAIRDGQKYVEVEFDEDDAIRLSLSKEKGVRFEGDRAYLPEEGFDLSGFFDRHVETAFIDYSALKNTQPKKSGKTSPAIPPGYAETLRQLRYSEHTVRAYTAYFKEFQQYFAGRNLRYIRPEEINAYIARGQQLYGREPHGGSRRANRTCASTRSSFISRRCWDWNGNVTR